MKDILIIFDLDWAPEPAIKFTADILRAKQIKSTWFLTHQSEELGNLQREKELFEFGIHPNFLENSTHGDTYKSVLDNSIRFFPEAKSIRTHAYFQSSPLLKLIAEKTTIAADLSTFLPHVQNIQPFKYLTGGRSLYRIPVFWEDDYEMKFQNQKWQPNIEEIHSPGLKIFAFHPIHILLNSSSMVQYKECINQNKYYQSLDFDQLKPYINQETRGVRDFLVQLITNFQNKLNFLSISDLLLKIEE